MTELGVKAFGEQERGACVTEIVEADIREDVLRSSTPESTPCDRDTLVLLTPLLTPLSAQHAETVSNH